MGKPSIAPRLNIAPSPPISLSPPSISSTKSSPIATGTSPNSSGIVVGSGGGSGLGGSSGSGISMSKSWVLPPRPKPGRKPSIDTPASKRKAQNRAAQRAFRERRATRVQELEQKLMEIEKEKDVKEMALINTINKLKYENQYLVKNLEQLKNEVNYLKKLSQHSHQQPNHSHQQPNHPHSHTNGGSNGSPVDNSPASSVYSVQQLSPAPSADSPPKKDDFDCGICLKDECLCEDVGLKKKNTSKNSNSKNSKANSKNDINEEILKFKPMQAVSLKRKNNEVEIDFTKKFTKKPLPDFKKMKTNSHQRQNSHPHSHPHSHSQTEEHKFDEDSPVDNCGFCSDDTPCVCREAAKEAALISQSLQNNQSNNSSTNTNTNDEMFDDKTSLPPLQLTNVRKTSLPVMHPGPSVEIREIANLTPGAVPNVTTPTTRNNENNNSSNNNNNNNVTNSGSPNKSSGCTGNPGTCEQCQMDPMSTLFCTTVANKEKEQLKSRSNSVESLETVEKLPPVSEITSSASTPLPSTPLPSTPINNPGNNSANGTNDMFIPCADAYKTLSRHKKFNSVDFSTLVGKLTTRGMQVEVQSVANVLRELDRRLYN